MQNWTMTNLLKIGDYMDSEFCNEHTAHSIRLNSLEKNIDDLWAKWDKMQTLLIATLTTMCLNLIGVITVIAKLF